jgi:hypothetical protein
MLEQYETETYILKLYINALQFNWLKYAERYTGKTKRVMLRELGILSESGSVVGYKTRLSNPDVYTFPV